MGLRERCIDSEVPVKMPPGNVYGIYQGEKLGTCWDILAHWTDLKPEMIRSSGKGISLFFSHFGDAHISCTENVSLSLDIACDKSLPKQQDPTAAGSQREGCHWEIDISTADDAVCKP